MKEAQAFFLFTLACVSGCVGAPVQPAAGTAAVQRPGAASSIVDYVSKAEVGQSGAVDQVTVQVVNAYAAASGRSCRQYLVTEAGGAARAHLACSSDQGWVEVRPLIAGEGAGREPRGP